uniref:Prominin-like protein n=1 Tax=Caenorhabditis japonica TaxID=281687 RepID=A0A8R1HX72_CAEJA
MILHLLIFSLLGLSSADLVFPPYKPSEQYKCGSFMEDRNGRKADAVLSFYYNTIDQFIALVSSPFPHQDLLNNQALTGDLNELQASVEKKYWQWLEWQKGWLALSVGLIAVSILFVIFYFFYKLCVCICSQSSKKQNTDARYDGCKRSMCNLLLFGLVSANAFVAFTLLMTSQYAQIGLDKLPNRMNQCIDDLQVYKRDSDQRIRKLLIDDYQVLNTTITKQLSGAGHNVVDRVKKLTGAHVIDVFMNVSKVAQEMNDNVKGVYKKVRLLNDEGGRFEAEFSRLQNTANEELVKCLENELEPIRSMCVKAERLLESLAVTQFKIDPHFLPADTETGLSEIVKANITQVLAASNAQFEQLENRIQHEIDKETHSANNMLKQIADDLFIVAETISTQLKKVNFDRLYSSVQYVSDPKKTPTIQYITYSWYVSLIVTSLFILLALVFLFGVLYGICGRRPTYYNDDCCVRSTGGKFYSFGIWIFLFIFIFLAVGTAVLMFAIGNFSNLVCQPLRSPLSHPDSLSLAERYVNLYKQSHTPENDIEVTLQSKSPSEIIRACSRNETLYNIYEFDKKYHLNQLQDFEKESYNQLQIFLKTTLENMPEIRPLDAFISRKELHDLEKLATVNVSKVSQQGLNAIKHAMDELDLVAKTREFEESLDETSGKPKAVTLVLEQIREFETQFAKPLRTRLEGLHSNITQLDEKLTQLQVPVSSLLVKLQHAQALLAENMKEHFGRAAKEEFQQMVDYIDQYITHVKQQMESEVTSCEPLAQIARHTTAAVCSYTIDPYNGTWMCMLICLTLLVPIVIISNSLIGLYSKMHAFPKYIVEPPSETHQMSSFITDTYDTRPKPGYANYTYTDDYQRNYR